MNFSFRQQNVGETAYLVFDMDDSLEIDSFAMHMMTYNRIANIVPAQIVRMNESRQIQFNITGLIKLSGRISVARPKKEVLGILSSILKAFEEVDAYMLDMDCLLLDWEYIYLDGQGNCMLMYLPLDYALGKDKIAFLQEVVSRIQPDYREKDPYLFDILNAFSRGAIQKLSDFREIIKKCAVASQEGNREEKKGEPLDQNQNLEPAVPKPAVPKPAVPKAVLKGMDKKPKKKFSSSPKIPVVNIPGREPGGKEPSPVPKEALERKEKEETKKKKSLFAIPKKKKAEEIEVPRTDIRSSLGGQQPAPSYGQGGRDEMYESYEKTVFIPEPSIAPVRGGGEETVMLEQPEFTMQPSAALIRRKDGAVYRIDGNQVIFGTGASADICIYNNHAISRSHAMIVCIGSDYYIEDNQSKNGSFINGRRLQPGVREPLYDGMLLRFADEDFTFSKD